MGGGFAAPACPAFRSPQGHLAFSTKAKNPRGSGGLVPQSQPALSSVRFSFRFCGYWFQDSSAGLSKRRACLRRRPSCGAASSTRRVPVWRPARTWLWACCASWSCVRRSVWRPRIRASAAWSPRRTPTSGGRCRSSCGASLLTCRPTRGSLAPGGRRRQSRRRRRSDGCRGSRTAGPSPGSRRCRARF